MARPVIAVTGPDEGGFPAWLAARAAVRAAGGRAVRVTPERGLPRAEVDGVILGGGADVSPARYADAPDDAPPKVREELRGDTPRGKARSILGYALSPAVHLFRRALSVRLAGLDVARDELELALLRRVEKDAAPVLGICRGAQLMNVHRGGTLYQDLSSFYVESTNPWTVFPRKWIEIDPQSRLARALSVSRCRVNSLHRQAVDRLGSPLAVCAREDNGVVQAIEDPSRDFFVGVQWHPEYLPQRPEQRRLFRAFVEAASACRARRASLVGRRLDAAHELVTDLPVSEEDAQGVDQAEGG